VRAVVASVGAGGSIAARELAEKVMSEAGVDWPIVPGMLNAGHLGGTVPLGREDVDGMRPAYLPKGLYVADLSLLPKSQGMPTMLTASALALRAAERVAEGQLRTPGTQGFSRIGDSVGHMFK